MTCYVIFNDFTVKIRNNIFPQCEEGERFIFTWVDLKNYVDLDVYEFNHYDYNSGTVKLS